jgi:hypothetical protein
MDAKNVFNPSHYGGKDNPFETIKVLEAWLTPDEMIGFCKGQSIAYLSRHRQKGGLEDLSKSLWYQQYLVSYLAVRGLTAHGPNTIAPDQQQPAKSEADKSEPDKQEAPKPEADKSPPPPAGPTRPGFLSGVAGPSALIHPQNETAGPGAGAAADTPAPHVDLDGEIAAIARKFAPQSAA